MDNELIYIAERLWNEFGSEKHYEVIAAQKLAEGKWSLVINEHKTQSQEAKDDN